MTRYPVSLLRGGSFSKDEPPKLIPRDFHENPVQYRDCISVVVSSFLSTDLPEPLPGILLLNIVILFSARKNP